MKRFIVGTALAASLILTISSALPVAAQAPAAGTGMRENTDGVIKPDEYERISVNGGLTRRPCPYTCEMRGIPRRHCKEWVSASDKTLCYVQDTRLPSDAMPNRLDSSGGSAEKRK